MTAPAFDAIKSSYSKLWSTMSADPARAAAVTQIAIRLLAHKSQYQAVASKTGVPWFVIAALHNRESGADFKTYLGNGEPLNRVTRLVPKGRGPFPSWDAGAIDALKIDGLNKVTDWSPERICYECEKFNGFGYRNHGINSPYLWSFSNHYTRGKYIADGEFSTVAVDQQCGTMPVVKRLMELDTTAAKPLPPKPQLPSAKKTGLFVVIVAACAGTAHWFGAHPKVIVGVVLFAVIAAAVGWAILRNRKAEP